MSGTNLLLACAQSIAILGNTNVDKEIKNLQNNRKKEAFSKDHKIVRKLIVFAILYITTRNLMFSITGTFALFVFNYTSDCKEEEEKRQEKFRGVTCRSCGGTNGKFLK